MALAVAARIHPRCRAEVAVARVGILGGRAGGGWRPGLAEEEEESRLLSSIGWIDGRLGGWRGGVPTRFHGGSHAPELE